MAVERDERGRAPATLAALRVLSVVLGGVLVVLSLWVVIQRFRYPIDAEWMTGAIRDGVDRVRDGKQLYVAPTARFIPFVYPPLYFWVSAFVARFCSTFVACKVVSIGATLAMGWGIFRISRKLGASSFWSGIALLLHVATYSLTLLFYDLERVDAFYAAMLVVGLAVLFTRETIAYSITAGAILGLAFFAKQSGALVFVAVVVGLLLAGERKRAGIVGLTGALLLVALGAYLESTTGGWFRYYCLTLPSAHGIRAERLSLFFIVDAPKTFAIVAGSIAVSVPLLWSILRSRRKPEGATWQEVVFASSVFASMAASLSFRAHAGGWSNVLVAWLPLGCAATAIAATHAEERARGAKSERLVGVLLLGGICLQLLAAMFDPVELSPSAGDMQDRERFIGLIRKLESEGEVLVMTTGGVSKESSAHAAALNDIVLAGHAAPKDLLEGLEARRYTAIFIGVPEAYDCGLPSCNELSSAIVRNYFVAGRRHTQLHTGMTGYEAGPPWLFRPRKHPLPALTNKELLGRQRLEKAFAEMKTSRSPIDVEITPADEIEELTARELAERLANP